MFQECNLKICKYIYWRSSALAKTTIFMNFLISPVCMQNSLTSNYTILVICAKIKVTKMIFVEFRGALNNNNNNNNNNNSSSNNNKKLNLYCLIGVGVLPVSDLTFLFIFFIVESLGIIYCKNVLKQSCIKVHEMIFQNQNHRSIKCCINR